MYKVGRMKEKLAMTHHLKQTEPQYTKGKLSIQGGFIVEENGDIVAMQCSELREPKASEYLKLICSSVNIIQSLADSLGVNAVELAQRMEEEEVMKKIMQVLHINLDKAFAYRLSAEILSKLEGRQG